MRFNIQTDNISFPSLAGQKKKKSRTLFNKTISDRPIYRTLSTIFEWKNLTKEASPTCIYPAKAHCNYPSTP